MFHRSSASTRDYDPPSASQQEELKPENAEGGHGSQYAFPSSNTGYTFDGAQHMNATFNQTSAHMQNLAPFSDVMVKYPSLLSSRNGLVLSDRFKGSVSSSCVFPEVESLRCLL